MEKARKVVPSGKDLTVTKDHMERILFLIKDIYSPASPIHENPHGGNVVVIKDWATDDVYVLHIHEVRSSKTVVSEIKTRPRWN